MSNYARLFQLIDNTPATNLTGVKSKRNPVLILLRGMKQKTFGFVPVKIFVRAYVRFNCYTTSEVKIDKIKEQLKELSVNN